MEWIFWLGALVMMAMMDPTVQGTSLCLFEAVGFPFCPGHGLAHSIAFTFRGQWMQALHAHPLGPVAILILVGRIFRLWGKAIRQTNLNQLTQAQPWQT